MILNEIEISQEDILSLSLPPPNLFKYDISSLNQLSETVSLFDVSTCFVLMSSLLGI